MSWLEIWAMIQVLGLVVPLSLFVLVSVYFILRDSFKEWRCKHEKYYENMACHGICRNCGKDLGFIGTLRDKEKNENS